MDAGIAQTLIHLGVAAGVMGPLWAKASETVHIIDTGRPLATGIGGTLIDVNVTSLSCESWGADTAVTVHSIHADTIDTGATSAVIEIDFTVNARRAGLAVALVAIHQVDAATLVQAGAAVTFIYLVTADGAHVPWVADTGVGINAILALTMMARIRITVVNVFLT